MVGDVSVVDDAPDEAKRSIEQSVDITRSDDLDAALEKVRDGDADAVLTEEDGEVTVLVRRGWRLLRDDPAVVAHAVAAGCRPVSPRRAFAQLSG